MHPLATALSCVLIAGAVSSQDQGEAELDSMVAALRAASRDEVVAAWCRIEQFVPTATHLSTAARTDALAAGLHIEPALLQLRVLRAMVQAPDSRLAARHLLTACGAQLAREEQFAKQRPEPGHDPELLRIFGYEPGPPIRKTLDDALGTETRALRTALLEACRAHVHPDTAAGLTLLVRHLASDPECDPLFAALLEHQPTDAIDGLLAVIAAGALRQTELKAKIDEAEKWRPRKVPLGRSKSEWERAEAEVKRKFVRLQQRRHDEFAAGLAAKIEQIRDYAKAHRLPAPPPQGTPERAWQRWMESVKQARVKPAAGKC